MDSQAAATPTVDTQQDDTQAVSSPVADSPVADASPADAPEADAEATGAPGANIQTTDATVADTPATTTQVKSTQADNTIGPAVEGPLTCITQIPPGQLSNETTTEFLEEANQYNEDGNAHIGIVRAFDVHRHFVSEAGEASNPIMVIDCRTVEEFETGHIDGALNYPLALPKGPVTFKHIGADPSGDISGPLIEEGESTDTQPNTRSLVLHYTKPQEVQQLVFYCTEDQVRSSALALWYKQSKLAEAKELMVMFGGLPAWQQGGGIVKVPGDTAGDAEVDGEPPEEKPDTADATNQNQSNSTTENGDHTVTTPTTSAEASQVLPPQAKPSGDDDEIAAQVPTHKWIPGTEPSPEEQAELMLDYESEVSAEEDHVDQEGEDHVDQGAADHMDNEDEISAPQATHKWIPGTEPTAEELAELIPGLDDEEPVIEEGHDDAEVHQITYGRDDQYYHRSKEYQDEDEHEHEDKDKLDYEEYKRWKAHQHERRAGKQQADHRHPEEEEEEEEEHHRAKEAEREKHERLEFERFKRWEAHERHHHPEEKEERRLERAEARLEHEEEEEEERPANIDGGELVRCESCRRAEASRMHVSKRSRLGMGIPLREGRGGSQFLLLRFDRMEDLSVWRFSA